jgi:beta-glucosidase
LPANQVAVLEAVAAINPEVVVVLTSGGVVAVGDWDRHAKAILASWLPGQGGGRALAELLVGDANPSGRLAETIPVRLSDNPSYLNFPGDSGHVRYGEGVFIGYRWYDARDLDVSYPFGHGLSYTTFAYDGLVVTTSGSHRDGDLAVTVALTVTNTGTVEGKEVAQVYVGATGASVVRPPRELKSFAKVSLGPGESRGIVLSLDARAFSYWSTPRQEWVVEAGDFEISVGASSRDLRLSETVHIDAPSIAAPLNARSTLQEWSDDPVGGPLLRSALALDDPANAGNPLRDAELNKLVGSMPLVRLAAFANFGVKDVDLDDLVSRVAAQSSSARPGGSAATHS